MNKIESLENEEQRDTIHKILEAYDSNKNGCLDRDEFKNLIKDLNAYLESIGIGLTDKEIDSQFLSLDKNNDGQIRLEEFAKFLGV
jgi:Ca2+-binding EF-hand superfamily protein